MKLLTALVFITLFFFILAFQINKENLLLPKVTISREIHSVNLNSSIHYINGGLSRFISAILWVRTLMDSDLERNFSPTNNSWMFYRFFTISMLDPKFLENYQLGGIYLSIVKDDLVGAETIFLKGLKYYPDDYLLNYNAAFLYFSELNSPSKALPLLLKVQSDKRAPKFIVPLIGTIMDKSEVPIKDIIAFVEAAKKENTNPILNEMYDTKLKKLKANL